MSRVEVRIRRGTWIALFCSAGAIAAACGSNPAVVNSGPHGIDSGGAAAVGGGSGGDATAATSTGGNAATGNIITSEGGDPNSGGPIVATALAFDPPSVTLTLGPMGAVNTATYALKATIDGGAMRTVTADSLQFDRPDIASFALGPPAVLTATGTVAGTGTLHAVFGGLEAKADLTVNIEETSVNGTIDKGTLDALNAANLPADAGVTALLYPYDKTVFPLGLASPLMMWTAPNPTGDVYRVHLEQKGYSYDYYSTVAAPAQLRVPQDAWDRVTASNSGDALKLTVSRWDSVAGKAYSSVNETFTIAPESLQGAIYYWTAQDNPTKGRIGSINRVYPGVGAQPEQLYQGRCMGCHSVSADGTTMVATIEDLAAPTAKPYLNWRTLVDPVTNLPVNVRAWASFALPAGTLATQTTKSGANSALTPDGKLVVFGGKSGFTGTATPDPVVPGGKFIELATTATGDVIADSGLDDMPMDGFQTMMPAFSPDGTKLAMVQSTTGDPYDNVLPVGSVRIFYLDFDQTKAKFDGATIHEIAKAADLPATENEMGYPSFSPDGKYVAFHSGQFSTGCHPGDCVDSTVDSGELWVSPTAGGVPPIRMANIDDPPAMADRMTQREPTFCPVSRGGYSWVVFTSMRDWGNAHVGPVNNAKRRLWVAAVDTTLGTVDPSHPAFYVEGQAEDTPNMRGFWALAQCIETPKPPATGAACTAGFQCCSGFCINGMCGDKTTLSCAGVGEACTSATDCCNSGGGVTDCVGGKCKVVEVPK